MCHHRARHFFLLDLAKNCRVAATDFLSQEPLLSYRDQRSNLGGAHSSITQNELGTIAAKARKVTQHREVGHV